jgi:hypothetical protein
VACGITTAEEQGSENSGSESVLIIKNKELKEWE